MGRENPLVLMRRDFEFYCLQLKKPVGIPKILVIFLPSNPTNEWLKLWSFTSKGYFSTPMSNKNIFFAIFSSDGFSDCL